MRSELNVFVQYLKKKGVVDNGTEVRDLSETIAAPPKGQLAWRYRIGKSTLQLAQTAVEWPRPVRSFVCILSMDIKGSVAARVGDRGEFDWSIDYMDMQLEFSADDPAGGAGWSQFWHFDTHADEPGATFPDESHPKFHFHFGGGEMKNRRLAAPNIWGRSLELHGPRLMHPPMDFVLALDFVFANAIGAQWRDVFVRDKEYREAVSSAQDRFWRPYHCAVSSFYNCRASDQPKHIGLLYCPAFQCRLR